jgi:hypothetical protein
MVSGSVYHENLRPFLEVISRLVGYEFDDLDWIAIEFGIDEAERSGPQLEFNWFEYPIGGVPVRLAWPGRIELAADAEIERAAALLITVMQDYVCTKA